MTHSDQLGFIASSLLLSHPDRAVMLEDIANGLRATERARMETATLIRRAAHQLAALIEDGLSGLTREERGDLRMLPCDMLAWADALDPDGTVGTMPAPLAEVIQLASFRPAPSRGDVA